MGLSLLVDSGTMTLLLFRAGQSETACFLGPCKAAALCPSLPSGSLPLLLVLFTDAGDDTHALLFQRPVEKHGGGCRQQQLTDLSQQCTAAPQLPVPPILPGDTLESAFRKVGSMITRMGPVLRETAAAVQRAGCTWEDQGGAAAVSSAAEQQQVSSQCHSGAAEQRADCPCHHQAAAAAGTGGRGC